MPMDVVTIDVHEELADAKLGRFHWRLGAAMGILTFFDGYDTFNPAYVIFYVMKPWGLAPNQAGLLVSSGLVGFLIGALLHGLIADRIGRRSTLLGGLWLTSVFTILTAVFADSFLSFCGLRLLTGLGLGLWGVALGWALGGTVAGLIGVFVTPHFGWQSLYWIGALSFLLLPLLHWQLPESPKFLILQNRLAEVRSLLARLRPERAALYAHADILADTSKIYGNSIAVLLTSTYRRTTITIWISAFLSLFCIFGLSGWIPTVMMQRGEAFAVSFGFGALMQIMSFIGGLACGTLADRFAHGRLFLAMWWIVGGFAVLVLVFFNTHVVNIAGATAAGFFVIGAQFILNNFTAVSYETGARATAVGMELGVGRVGAILGPVVAGTLQQIYHTPTAMFLASGAAATLAGVSILCNREPEAARAAVMPSVLVDAS